MGRFSYSCLVPRRSENEGKCNASSDDVTRFIHVAEAGSSESFAKALSTEHEALVERIRELRLRADRLRGLAEQAERQASEEENYLRELEGLLGIAPQLRLESLNLRLRGQRLQEVAVEILSDKFGAGKPIHYREWYDLLRAAGHEVGGKDPLANFLAHVARAPEVESVSPRSGLYRLRVLRGEPARAKAA